MTLEIVLAGLVSVGIAVWSKLEERRERRQVPAVVRRSSFVARRG
jgi:hypothetical protein